MAEQINPFAKAQAAREAEQAQIKNNLGLITTSNTNKNTTNRRVRLDVTIPANTKQKLLDYAKSKGLSASVVVQLLIDNACL